MHSNVTIQNELKELSSILAGVSNTNVYTVPNGYFEAMIQDIFHTLQEELTLTSNSTVPEGYFDNLADVIMNKIKSNPVPEAKESPLLLSLKTIPTYSIPLGYFDSIAETVK